MKESLNPREVVTHRLRTIGLALGNRHINIKVINAVVASRKDAWPWFGLWLSWLWELMRVTSSFQLLLPPHLQESSETTSFTAFKILTVKIFLPISPFACFCFLSLLPACREKDTRLHSLEGWCLYFRSWQLFFISQHLISPQDQSTGDPGVTGGKPVSQAQSLKWLFNNGESDWIIPVWIILVSCLSEREGNLQIEADSSCSRDLWPLVNSSAGRQNESQGLGLPLRTQFGGRREENTQHWFLP